MHRVSLQRIGAAVLFAVVVATAGLPTRAASQSPGRSTSRVALTRELPRLDGNKLAATLVEVTYPPGGSNPPHRHPCPVVGYVLEGRLRMQVKGQPERVYGPGDSFYESPADVHLLSANASQAQPARFLAYFVCDHSTAFSVPVPGDAAK